MERREFLKTVGSAAGAAVMGCTPPKILTPKHACKPNVLWISIEDTSPDLGCYGDPYAVTPALDRLAAEGVRFDRCFTHAGVCAPSRSGVITGMYPTSIGTQHMRCKGVPQPEVRCFTEYLRTAGYFCTNRSKTDYQFDPPLTAWDECNKEAHWRHREPGQPFFSVFNLTTTHESQIRSQDAGLLRRLDALSPGERHDPAQAQLPPYYPDTDLIRRDWARYYDLVTLVDKEVAEILKELESDGLSDSTLVWFWGDHGRGLPRAKRWIYDSGMRTPLILRVPEQFKKGVSPEEPEAVAPGSVNRDLVCFVDFAPTMLSLAGIDVPSHMQGQAFLGPQKRPARTCVFGHRDRMDETYDCIRGMRDIRYKYIRNFMPYLSRGQAVSYGEEMPTLQEMRRLHKEGRLIGPQQQFFEPDKPIEELYDLEADPHEVHNLAADRLCEAPLIRMRQDLLRWMIEVNDVGLIPEPDFDAMKRAQDQWETTRTPTFEPSSESASGRRGEVKIFCDTPGASLAYRIDEGTNRPYSKPILLDPGQTLHAQACRLGFKDSAEALYRSGDPVPAADSGSSEGLHWRDRVSTGLLEKLLAIKSIDHSGKASDTLAYLRDQDAPARYWAVVGLHRISKDTPIEEAVGLVRPLLKDPSLSVQVAAAHALCDWTSNAQALSVLVNVLKHGDTASARLFAVTALESLGDKARSCLPDIEVAAQGKDEYVVRVARKILKRGGSDSSQERRSRDT